VARKKYTLIETNTQIETLCEAILMQGQYPPPVIGVDCEGLIRKKPIAVIQVSF